jgi:hypothetical protein
MKKLRLIGMLAMVLAAFSACDRVAPNYYGVLMENYGKSGKSDYSRQQGRVSVVAPGTELFQVPAWEQRAEFTETKENKEGESVQVKKSLHLKAADNTEFNASPLYTYKAIENRVVDLVFQNSRLGSGNDFMRALEDNVLEPMIYDIIKEESRTHSTDTMMANGGSLRFEKTVETKIKKAFEEKGLELLNFSSNLDFSDKVKAKIDSRNEVNTNVSVIDQQIIEQRKRNELAKLKAEENIIISSGITPQLLQQQAIQKWNGTIYGETPFFLKNIK